MSGSSSGSLLLRVVGGPDVGLCALVRNRLVVGRGSDALPLTDPRVSRQHLELVPAAGGLLVTDLRSAGGTTVRGRPIVDRTLVSPGDTIELGAGVLRVLRVATGSSVAGGSEFVVRRSGRVDGVDNRAGSFTLGRDDGCDVTIVDGSVSRLHATFERGASGWAVRDERSANGTFVNGQRIVETQRLTGGDEVTFGVADVRVVYAPALGQGDVRIRLGNEIEPRRYAVTISASAGSTVAEVCARAVAYLGMDGDVPSLLVRTQPGLVLWPKMPWADTGVADGEEVVVCVGEVPVGCEEVAVTPGPARRAVNQLPRSVHRAGEHSVRSPEVPETTRMRGRGLLLQVMGGGVTMLGGLALAIVRPEFLIFGVIMAGVGLLSVSMSVVTDQARRRRRFADFQRRIVGLEQELATVQARQAEMLRAASPDDDTLFDIVVRRTPRMWERRIEHTDALMLRLGTGSTSTALSVEQSPFQQFGRHEGDEFADVVARHRVLSDVPITTPGRNIPLVGVVGDRARVHDVVARCIVEAAALHPPDQLRIWVLADTPAWDWCRWLPHAVDNDLMSVARSADEANALALELRDVTAGGLRDRDRRPTMLHLVVVVHDARRLANVSELVQSGIGDAGQIISVAEDARALPSGVGTLVVVGADGTASMEGQHPDPPLGRFVADAPAIAISMRVAREFASMTLATSGKRAGSAGLVELATGSALGELDVTAGWARHHARVAGPIGLADDSAPVMLDFRRDGPHGMIAGTTGSGKSELLQTLLTGLVLMHDPRSLNLFLIDFKGGATFSPLAELPHVVGVVTDLENDGDLATRAFTALDAEIDRRKRMLDAAAVPNIIDYERLPESVLDPMPSLLVVIDEFALLVKQQPELRDRLDTVATQGRSLGVHLLLATQSPTGVITNAIRLNTNLWICLRVVSDAESTELLGRRDAARIPTDRAGRGYIRKGASDTLVGFQAARIARDLDVGGASIVDISPFVDDRPRSTARPSPEQGPRGRRITELDVTVGKVLEATRAAGVPANRTLWTAPLPVELDARAIPASEIPAGRLVGVVGLVDVPQQQLVRPAEIDLSADGHAMFVGVLGSGRTTGLRQLALDLTERYTPDEVHMYGLDAGAGSLSDLARLPHVAAVVPLGDEERLTRLFTRVHRELEARRAALTLAGAGDFSAWQRSPGVRTPYVVVLIDDYAAMRQVLETLEGGRFLDVFNALINGGPAVGIHLVLAIAQTIDLRPSHMNLVGARVVLRPSDATDFQLIDVRLKADQFARWPPGRGLVRGGYAVQIAMPTSERIDTVVARWAGTEAWRLPRPIERLPSELLLDEISPPEGSLPDRAFVLGVGGDDCDPVVVDVERGGGMLLVVGPNQSGRSTTLRSVMASVLAREPDTVFALLAPRRSALRDLQDHPSVEVLATTTGEITAALIGLTTRAGPPIVVLLDDAESLPSANPDPLEAALRRAAETGDRFVVVARTTDLQSLYDPWARYIQTQRFVLALQPGPAEYHLVNLRSAPDRPSPPGRGLLFDRGTSTLIQVHRSLPAAPTLARCAPLPPPSPLPPPPRR